MGIELKTIADLLEDIRCAPDNRASLNTMFLEMQDQLQAETICIFLRDPETGHYYPHYHKKVDRSFLEHSFVRESDPLWLDLRNKRVLFTGEFLSFMLQHTYSHLGVALLSYHERKYGLVAITRNSGKWDEQDLQKLRIFGSLLSLCLEINSDREKLDNLQAHDSLTGLYNYRGFVYASDVQFAQAKRYGRVLTLAMLKLGDLDQISQTQGEQKARAIKILVAERLLINLRNTEIVGVVYNDTFAILLPETSKQNTLIAVLRIDKALKTMPELDEVDISWAVVTLSSHIHSLEQFLQIGEKTCIEARELETSNILVFDDPH